MKKLICLACAFALLISAGVPAASAYGHGSHSHSSNNPAWCDRSRACKNQTQCSSDGTCIGHCQFADNNGDGICDNCESVCLNCENGIDEDGNGICDNCEKCSHYADADQDGICDHYKNCENRQKPADKPAKQYSQRTYNASHHGGGHHGRKHH